MDTRVACEPANDTKSTLGHHIARRLVQIGITDVFCVPGEFNFNLLDQLIAAEPELNLVGCCNELNAGYAADGYARSRGIGACVVTFNVGGLSVLNAIAGAYSENLPVICIVGGPNSNDYGTNRILHHSIGLSDFSQELKCFQTVTGHQAVVKDLEHAHSQIDEAIAAALTESKPVYISVSCNLPASPHPSFNPEPADRLYITPKLTHQEGLEIAVEAAAKFLNKALKPVIVAGQLLRVTKSRDCPIELADSCGYALAIIPSAKGLVPEDHSHFIESYWGILSTPFSAEIVESADAYLFAGAIFDEFNSVGFSLLVNMEKAVVVQPQSVVIENGPRFGCIEMKDFLKALARRLKCNATAYKNYRRIYVPEGLPLQYESDEGLRVNIIFKHIQNLLSSNTTVIAEAGDSWFNCQKLKLPRGCGYEFQLNYGSIGWSVAATLGYAQASPDKRLVSCIGDGSFQVQCEEELIAAIKTATEDKEDCLCFIEVILDKEDSSKELIQFGCKISARSNPPKL